MNLEEHPEEQIVLFATEPQHLDEVAKKGKHVHQK
jgi:hypothetical protein